METHLPHFTNHRFFRHPLCSKWEMRNPLYLFVKFLWKSSKWNSESKVNTKFRERACKPLVSKYMWRWNKKWNYLNHGKNSKIYPPQPLQIPYTKTTNCIRISIGEPVCVCSRETNTSWDTGSCNVCLLIAAKNYNKFNETSTWHKLWYLFDVSLYVYLYKFKKITNILNCNPWVGSI